MNENTLILVTAACIAIFFLGFAIHQAGLAMGRTWERERIYDRCLAINASMIHRDAVVKCKEIVK